MRIRCTLLLAFFASFSAAQTPPLSGNVTPAAYRIAVTPDLAASRFAATEQIDFDLKQSSQTIQLNAVGLDLTSVKLADGNQPQATVTADDKAETITLRFPAAINSGRHTLLISYSGPIRTTRSGLFSVAYTNASAPAQLLVTQFEFSAARRMFPCVDEPAAKATFTLSATLPAADIAISNTPVASEKPIEAAANQPPLKQVTFATTPRMSSYLLVLVAGELQSVSGVADNTALTVWTVPGRAQSGHAALAYTQKLLPLYNSFFAYSYPLPKLDLIAVPQLGFDAMENWGGITFNADQLLYDAGSSSDASLRAVQHLVGHEVAHQWFGDLVTAATWKDVWLNESLAEWTSYKATQQLSPEEQPWLNFHAAKKRAMDRDAGPTQPVVGSGFDANTSYRKGPALLRMIETYLGEQTFQRGIQSYMRAHAYANATTADLWSSLEKVSGKPVAAMAGTFSNQPGIPLVEVNTRCESGNTQVTLTQRRFTIFYPEAEPLTWQIPITIAQVGARTGTVQSTILGGSPVTLHFSGCNAPIKVNIGDNGYYHAQYNDADRQKLTSAFPQLSPADRVNLLTDQWALVQSAGSPAGAWLDLTQQLSHETEPIVWTDIITVFRQIDSFERSSSGQAAFRAYARTLLHPLMIRLGWEPGSADQPETIALRSLAISALGEFDDPAVIAEANRRFQAYRDGSHSLPPDLRGPILEAVGRHADGTTYDQLLALAKSAKSEEDKRDLYLALASVQDPALIDRTVALTEAQEDRTQFTMMLVAAAQRTDADHLVRDVEADRRKVLGGKLSAGLLDALAEHTSDPDIATQLRSDPAFGSHTPGSLRSIAVNHYLQPLVRTGVADWLERNAAARP